MLQYGRDCLGNGAAVVTSMVVMVVAAGVAVAERAIIDVGLEAVNLSSDRHNMLAGTMTNQARIRGRDKSSGRCHEEVVWCGLGGNNGSDSGDGDGELHLMIGCGAVILKAALYSAKE